MTKKLTVNAEEFSKMLGCSKAHVLRLIHRNELKHIKLGRRYVIPLSVVKDMLGEDFESLR